MPSTIFIQIETDGGERRGLHSIVVPDFPPHQGMGSRFRAERLAVQGIGAIMDAFSREQREDPGPD